MPGAEPRAPEDGEALAERLLGRDRDAVSPSLNLVDDRRPAARAEALRLLDALARRESETPRVGITGAPGAGKSTLLDALVRTLRGHDETVGLIAVDPSSQRTGGALLGDRFRMRSGARDPGVFLRSMAARDRLGGLADATAAGLEILCAVFDRVFVETVGVGQSETEIARLVDSVVFVAQPGAGDLLQFMKAGIIEVPDVFVVNKLDLGPVAERTAHELEAGLGLGQAQGSGWVPPVLRASARDGTGIDALVEALDAHAAHLAASGERPERRRRGRAATVHSALLRRYGAFGLERLGGAETLDRRLEADPAASPFALVETLAREIESALGKPD